MKVIREMTIMMRTKATTMVEGIRRGGGRCDGGGGSGGGGGGGGGGGADDDIRSISAPPNTNGFYILFA
jgi:hypothetical protein